MHQQVGMSEFGYGQGYKYPHDYDGDICYQEYMPTEIRNEVFYIVSFLERNTLEIIN